MTKSTFLPEGYEKPAGNSRYMRFEEGENKFRILSDAVVGWVDWENKKPVRTKEQLTPLSEDSTPKHFWSFIVWNYKESNIKILEITQSKIQKEIYNLHMSEEWGDPKGYGINVKREGMGFSDTTYSVIPTPPKPLDKVIEEAYANENINLEALFDNGDPFSTSDTQKVKESKEVSEELKTVDPGAKDISVDDIPF